MMLLEVSLVSKALNAKSRVHVTRVQLQADRSQRHQSFHTTTQQERKYREDGY